MRDHERPGKTFIENEREIEYFFLYAAAAEAAADIRNLFPDVRCQGSSTAARRAKRALDSGHPGITFPAIGAATA
ncbi:MAG: hypothetical protein ACM369_15700, partial [Acidobacteriota bacterium]